MVRLAAGFGLAFLLVHTVYIYHFIDSSKLIRLYTAFWYTFALVLMLSIVLIVHTFIMRYFKKEKELVTSFLPLFINIIIFLGICIISVFK
jgi:hypothetical protein